MRRLRVWLFVLVAFSALAFSAQSALAVSNWYHCSVVSAGPASDGRFWAYLTDDGGQFTNLAFQLYPAVKKEQLATCLTAYANGGGLYVYTDFSLPASSRYIQIMYAEP